MLGGWALNALMVYLIIVTARSVPKIWDPYEVLGVSRVCVLPFRATNDRATLIAISLPMRNQSRSTTESSPLACTPTRPARTLPRTSPSKQSTTTGST